MQGFEVTLEDHGLFHVPALRPEDGDRKIAYDPETKRNPWVITEMDATSRWHRVLSFTTLDEALDWAVSAATGILRPNYRVMLPCGQHFSRPGRVPAESVLSSMGWVYVTHLIGFHHFNSPAPCSEHRARRHFIEHVQDSPSVVVGDVTPCDDGENCFWIADLRIPFDGFIRREDIEAEKNISFASERIALEVKGFDCIVAVGGEARSADLISLADHIAARQMKAA
jgi:hypothetical protein